MVQALAREVSTSNTGKQAGPADDAPHLLVVDDDRRIRELLLRYLGEHGYRVSMAANAAQARAKLKAARRKAEKAAPKHRLRHGECSLY